MFKQVTLKNFRTHKSTTVELYPVTLLIGNNNSGKTNLLAGIQHFSNLVRRGRPGNSQRRVLAAQDFYPHKYRLAGDNEPISFSIFWTIPEGEISYSVSVYKNNRFKGKSSCTEEIIIRLTDAKQVKRINSGHDQETDILDLENKVQTEQTLDDNERKICNLFFEDFANTFNYHFQPTFLKGMVQDKNDNDINEEKYEINNNLIKPEVKIPAYLGETGSNFQNIIRYIQKHEQRVFSLFLAKMRTLDPSFQGVIYDEKRASLIWQFDLGRKGYIEEFTPKVVSDGFMKIAAISLLASLRKPPALIMLEEIENGINPGNIQQLMNWIWQAASFSQDGNTLTQFILTSHSPSVLREFNQHPDHVYTVRLNKSNRQSDVRNLNNALDTLVGIGAIKDDEVEYETEENTDKKLIKIPKYQLAELWYSGTIG